MKNLSKIESQIEVLGLKYISKFETTENHFRKYLLKKICLVGFEIENSYKNKIANKILKKMKDMNYINDTRYAKNKSCKILLSGGSKKLITLKLKEKGISNSIIEQIFNDLDEQGEIELSAAMIYLKKKKMGVFNNKKKQLHALELKWYSTLSRRGFPYSIASEALNIKLVDDAENIINRMKI